MGIWDTPKPKCCVDPLVPRKGDLSDGGDLVTEVGWNASLLEEICIELGNVWILNNLENLERKGKYIIEP